MVRGRTGKCWDRTEAKKGREQNLKHKKDTKGKLEQWGKKREEYTMRFEVKFKKYWTNRSNISEKPQQGQ